ncbi:MAG TPA: hypothetical protein DEG70_11465 [Chloroflexi bacterium]|nr:hypothetical protein [Chloroflexota bacterium]
MIVAEAVQQQQPRPVTFDDGAQINRVGLHRHLLLGAYTHDLSVGDRWRRAATAHSDLSTPG